MCVIYVFSFPASTDSALIMSLLSCKMNTDDHRIRHLLRRLLLVACPVLSYKEKIYNFSGDHYDGKEEKGMSGMPGEEGP